MADAVRKDTIQCQLCISNFFHSRSPWLQSRFMGYRWNSICSGQFCHRNYQQLTQIVYLPIHSHNNHSGNSWKTENQEKSHRIYTSGTQQQFQWTSCLHNPWIHVQSIDSNQHPGNPHSWQVIWRQFRCTQSSFRRRTHHQIGCYQVTFYMGSRQAWTSFYAWFQPNSRAISLSWSWIIQFLLYVYPQNPMRYSALRLFIGLLHWLKYRRCSTTKPTCHTLWRGVPLWGRAPASMVLFRNKL